jgi:immunity protein 52 of polymorphic toxin system
MSSEAYKLYVGWQARPESARSCAARLARMLQGLTKAHPAFARWNKSIEWQFTCQTMPAHPAFARWNKKADTRAAADKPAWAMPPNIDEVTEVFENGRYYKAASREPWPELGYSVAAWNGLERPFAASLRVSPGGYSLNRAFPNDVDLELNPASPDNADLTSVAT